MTAGHEHARAAVLSFLEQQMPAWLGYLRAQLGVDSPVDPKAYLLDDMLPDNDPSKYPCVMVRSTALTDVERRSVSTAGEAAVLDFDYRIEVVVACARDEFVSRTAGAPGLLTSTDRDRLMLAARWALLGAGDLGDSARVMSLPTEETGTAQQTLRGNPLAAGTLTFTVRVAEEIPDLAVAQAIASHQLVVDGRDASQPIT